MTDAAPATEAPKQFVYVTYIRAAPERVWEALTDPATIKTFWFGVTAESDFKAGSPWRLLFADGNVADTGEILESDPPRRLVIKWRHELKPEMKAEGYSQCVMALEAIDGSTKLTVSHSMERSGTQFVLAVSGGWPHVLSNLKSLLETGEIATPPRKG